MLIFHGDPLMRRGTDFIYRVVEAIVYNYWISMRMHWRKLLSRKIAIVHLLDGCYSYHLQPTFYLFVMGYF